jgi:tRNA (guanine37-N1)-methyltransferase
MSLSGRLRETLSQALSPQDLACVYNSYDVVGDIAIIRFAENSIGHGPKIAEAVMQIHRNVVTVLAQVGGVNGDFRLRKLEWVAGKRKTLTVHKEWGCTFLVDVEKCYFSPRLSYERMRIARQVQAGETVLNMFAGVGCFSVIVARCSEAEKVYSIDVNPSAVRCMRENTRLNKVCGRVVPLFGDSKRLVKERFHRVADRVLMPLPEKAFDYLPYALLALKKMGGRIHYYGLEYAKKKQDAPQKNKLRVARKLRDLGAMFNIPFCRVVRATGPHWYQTALDIQVSRP